MKDSIMGLSIGDPREVRKWNELTSEEVWKPASVGMVGFYSIVAVYTDGSRETLPYRRRAFRKKLEKENGS